MDQQVNILMSTKLIGQFVLAQHTRENPTWRHRTESALLHSCEKLQDLILKTQLLMPH